MSRAAAKVNLIVTRGATWEDSFTYTEDDQITPISLVGYEARLQVRTMHGAYGTSTATTLMLELTTAPGGGLLWDTAINGVLRIVVAPADHAALNPANKVATIYAYAVEVYIPAGVEPEYVIPLAHGVIKVKGEIVR